MNAAPGPGKSLTSDGLAFKRETKITRINCDYSLMDVRPLTWQCNRLIRRDFYLVYYKMFFVLHNPANKRIIRKMLHDVREEAEALDAVTRRHEIPAVAPFSELHLRMVIEEARLLVPRRSEFEGFMPHVSWWLLGEFLPMADRRGLVFRAHVRS